MKPRSLKQRRVIDRIIRWASGVAAALACCMLIWILFEVVRRGGSALNLAIFTKLPSPAGVEGGGLANAIVGTLLLTALATVVGVPLGALAGIYLAEFGRGSRLAAATRFAANSLMGVPSIIIGVFVYTLVVIPMGNFSGWAGALALAIIMLPIIARTTEDMLVLVPSALRESALALGAPRWRVTLGIVFRAARGGLLTGCLLALARVSGESAPLLFTALNSPYWSKSLDQPLGNLTVTIFQYAGSPYDNWQQLSWAGSLLITAGILLLTIISRLAVRTRRP